MKRNIHLWQLMGFAVVSLVGTLLHFLYDWTGQSVLAAPFSGVNESTWEHMKLLYVPLFLYAIVQSYFFREYKNFWCVKMKGTLIGLTAIPVLFYTLRGAFGETPDWINIAIFFVSAAAVFWTENRWFQRGSAFCPHPKGAFLILSVIGILFILFTFLTPAIPLFLDPVTGLYGIPS